MQPDGLPRDVADKARRIATNSARLLLWRMDPGQEKLPLANRGAALWGNFVITVANYPPRVIATDKENGRVVWEANLSDGRPTYNLRRHPSL
jgi:hypothetical protein